MPQKKVQEARPDIVQLGETNKSIGLLQSKEYQALSPTLPCMASSRKICCGILFNSTVLFLYNLAIQEASMAEDDISS